MAKDAFEQPEPQDEADLLEMAPPCLAGHTADEPEIIRWVARNIDNAAVTPEDCPDPFAWTLLRQLRANPALLAFFIEKLWAKLLPSRSAQEKSDGDSVIDGTPTIELIERIVRIRDRVKQDSGVAQDG